MYGAFAVGLWVTFMTFRRCENEYSSFNGYNGPRGAYPYNFSESQLQSSIDYCVAHGHAKACPYIFLCVLCIFVVQCPFACMPTPVISYIFLAVQFLPDEATRCHIPDVFDTFTAHAINTIMQIRHHASMHRNDVQCSTHARHSSTC
jgi:hypothetical protein